MGELASKNSPLGNGARGGRRYRRRVAPLDPSKKRPNQQNLSNIPEFPDEPNNDAGRRMGGAGPDGPDGWIHDFLLERNYTVTDDNIESEYEYAMCYKCHQRSIVLSDQSFPKHREHVVGARGAPCSACHDPHGISTTQVSTSDHTHLINFDTTIVRPETRTGRLEFKDLGRFAGSCTLVCHGKRHNDVRYGDH